MRLIEFFLYKTLTLIRIVDYQLTGYFFGRSHRWRFWLFDLNTIFRFLLRRCWLLNNFDRNLFGNFLRKYFFRLLFFERNRGYFLFFLVLIAFLIIGVLGLDTGILSSLKLFFTHSFDTFCFSKLQLFFLFHHSSSRAYL